MAIPTFVAVGSHAAGAGAGISPGEPAGSQDGDYQILVIQTANQAPALFGGKEAGFTAITGGTAGVGTGGAAGATGIWLYERIRSGASQPVLDDSGDHQIARIIGFRGQAGSDYRAVVATNTQAATTSGSATGGTTTTDENIIAAFIGQAGPDTLEGTNLSSPAASGLTSVTERADLGADDGIGGLIGIITGEQASAGAFGPVTYTSANSFAKAHVVISITSGAGGGGGGGQGSLGGLAGRGGLAGAGGLAGRGGGLAARVMQHIDSMWRPKRLAAWVGFQLKRVA
jgi:hypothetical protein